MAMAALLLAATDASAQCAMCGTAIQGDDPLARGILWSVLFLISLPYAIVGAFVFTLFRLSRRERLRRENAPLHLVGGLGLVTGRKENVK
jgi:hypothetical protein